MSKIASPKYTNIQFHQTYLLMGEYNKPKLTNVNLNYNTQLKIYIKYNQMQPVIFISLSQNHQKFHQ